MSKETGITFSKFCKILDAKEIGMGKREGVKKIYEGRIKKKGYVSEEYAKLVADTISAQNLELEW